MSRLAIVRAGRVDVVFDTDRPRSDFPDIDHLLVEAPAEVEQGWYCNGLAFDQLPFDLDVLRLQRTAAIDAERDRLLNVRGFQDRVSGKAFQTDPVSQQKIAAVGTLAGFAVLTGQARSFDFIAYDNTVVTMPAPQAFDWAKRVGAWVSAVILAAAGRKAAVRAAANRAGVLAVDVLADWPVED